MDLSEQISKLSKKNFSLSETLDTLHPNLSISRFRETISPISSNLSVFSRIESQCGQVCGISFAGHGSSRNPEGQYMLCSVTDQGEITIWNYIKEKPMFRTNIITEDPWLITCAFEHRESALLVTGGSEGKLHLFRIGKTLGNETILSEHPLISLKAHESYISNCEFLTAIEVLSCSGDSTCKLWALQPSQDPIRVFHGHVDDVMSIATSPLNPSIFLTGGCDATTRLWDVRVLKGNVYTYNSHIGHVNSVRFLYDSEFSFAIGCSDGNCKLYDLRTLKALGCYPSGSPITDLVFSHSGRLLIAADEDGKVKIWDTFDERVPVQILSPHYEKINCMEISADGENILTASTDCTMGILRND